MSLSCSVEHREIGHGMGDDERTQRSRSFLAAAAVETYVDRELAIIEDIAHGLADVKAGRTVSHEDAMASLQSRIDAAAGGLT